MLALNVLKLIWTHPANRGRRVSTLSRSVSWQIMKRLTGKARTITVFDDVQMRCYPDSHGAGLMIYTNGMPDYDDIQFTSAYLRPGDHFLDIGANVGIYTLLAASRVGPSGKVISIEAGRKSFARLTENVELNAFQQVAASFAAVGPESGEVRFLQNRDLVNRLALDELSHEADAETVPAVTIDELVNDQTFAMGKIDIEGAEPLAFRGATDSLRTGNPRVWLIELKDRLMKKYGFDAADFAQFLRDQGYQLGCYDAERSELTFNNDPWEGRENVVAVYHTAIDSVQQRVADGLKDVRSSA